MGEAFTEANRIIRQTAAARDRAAVLLDNLVEVKKQTEAFLQSQPNWPARMLIGPGENLDHAIAVTRSVVERLERTMRVIQGDGDDDAVELLDEAAQDMEGLEPLGE